MSIVLNEYEYAEKAIRERELGKKPGETLCRVAKYYLHNGYTKKETRDLLDAFVIRCDPNSSVTKWSAVLDNSVKYAAKHPLVILDEIPITVSELKKIDSIKSVQAKRLAFTLLCVAKYRCLAKGNTGFWVGTSDSEIMSMANVNTSIKRQSLMFSQLRDAGLIRFSKKIDNLDVQVLFADDGDPVLHITDFRNLGYQYLKYCGEPYFECQCCGLTIKQNTGAGRKQKYCPCCATKVKMQQSVNCVMRKRGTIQDDGRYTVYLHLFPNDKVYVGITKRDLDARWVGGTGYSGNDSMCSAIKKYGWDNVKHYILYKDLDVLTARKYEALLIKEFRSNVSKFGYNQSLAEFVYETNPCSEFLANRKAIEVDGLGHEIISNNRNNYPPKSIVAQWITGN